MRVCMKLAKLVEQRLTYKSGLCRQPLVFVLYSFDSWVQKAGQYLDFEYYLHVVKVHCIVLCCENAGTEDMNMYRSPCL